MMKNNKNKHQKQASKKGDQSVHMQQKKTTQKKIKISRLTLPLSSTSHVVHHLHCFIVTLFYTFSTFHAHIDPYFLIWKKISCFSDLFGGKSEKPDLKYWLNPCKAQNRRGFWNFRKKNLSELPKNANSKIYSETPKNVLIWKKNQDFYVLRRF